MEFLQLFRIIVVNDFRQSGLQVTHRPNGIGFYDFFVFKSSDQVFTVSQNLLSAWPYREKFPKKIKKVIAYEFNNNLFNPCVHLLLEI